MKGRNQREKNSKGNTMDSPNLGNAGSNQLKAFVERIERLMEELKALQDDVKDVYAEAKGNGFDTNPDRVCIYFDNQLIARHTRRYGRHEDIEDPDHAKSLIAQRRRAREQRLMMHFLALSPDAEPITMAWSSAGLTPATTSARSWLWPRSTPPMSWPAPSPTGSPSRPSAPSTSPTSGRPEPVRCRSPDHCNSPVATTCSISTSLPRTSTPTR